MKKSLIFSLLVLITSSCNQNRESTMEIVRVDDFNYFKNSFDNYLKSNLNTRTENIYTLNQAINHIDEYINYNYTFTDKACGSLNHYEFQFEFSSNTISELELFNKLASTIQSLYNYYQALNNSYSDLVSFSINLSDNLNSNGTYTINVSSLFVDEEPVYSTNFINGTCTGEGPFNLPNQRFINWQSIQVPCQGSSAKSLEKVINKKLKASLSCACYFVENEYSCAGSPGFEPSCLRPVKYYHDVMNYDDPISNDNRVDYRVFYGNAACNNFTFCVPFDDQNCYFSWAFSPISQQYNPAGKTWHKVFIDGAMLAPAGHTTIGHGMTLIYGIKKFRTEMPKKLPFIN